MPPFSVPEIPPSSAVPFAPPIGLSGASEVPKQDFEGDEIDRAKAFPGYREAPNAPVGRPYFVPTSRVSLGQRLKRGLGRSKP